MAKTKSKSDEAREKAAPYEALQEARAELKGWADERVWASSYNRPYLVEIALYELILLAWEARLKPTAKRKKALLAERERLEISLDQLANLPKAQRDPEFRRMIKASQWLAQNVVDSP